MKYVTIEVTREHIRDGSAAMCAFCPVALAIKSKIGLCCRVHPDEIVLGRHRTIGPSVKINTPKKVASFITRFDMQLPVKAFKFRLPLTDLEVVYV
jgi:hypothetical protein